MDVILIGYNKLDSVIEGTHGISAVGDLNAISALCAISRALDSATFSIQFI